LVDDTVIFAGRLRRAKAEKHARDQANDIRLGREFDDRDVVEVVLIPGISHGFLQFVGIFPEGWKYIHRCGRWIEHIFSAAEERELQGTLTPGPGYGSSSSTGKNHHRRKTADSSGDEDQGLEMTMLSPKGKGKQKDSEQRKRKEKLLQEQLRERGWGAKGDVKGEKLRRKKSMVSLASEDDLLGRRMLGLAGPLTGSGDVDDEL